MRGVWSFFVLILCENICYYAASKESGPRISPNEKVATKLGEDVIITWKFSGMKEFYPADFKLYFNEQKSDRVLVDGPALFENGEKVYGIAVLLTNYRKDVFEERFSLKDMNLEKGIYVVQIKNIKAKDFGSKLILVIEYPDRENPLVSTVKLVKDEGLQPKISPNKVFATNVGGDVKMTWEFSKQQDFLPSNLKLYVNEINPKQILIDGPKLIKDGLKVNDMSVLSTNLQKETFGERFSVKDINLENGMYTIEIRNIQPKDFGIKLILMIEYLKRKEPLKSVYEIVKKPEISPSKTMFTKIGEDIEVNWKFSGLKKKFTPADVKLYLNDVDSTKMLVDGPNLYENGKRSEKVYVLLTNFAISFFNGRLSIKDINLTKGIYEIRLKNFQRRDFGNRLILRIEYQNIPEVISSIVKISDAKEMS